MDRVGRRALRKIRLRGLGTFVAVSGVEPETLWEAVRAHRETRDSDRCLKSTHDRLVTRVRLRLSTQAPATEVVVKKFQAPWRWRVLQALGWPSRFSRDPHKEQRLGELGIRVPRFIAASLRVSRGREFLITEFVNEGSSLRDVLWCGNERVEDPAALRDLLAQVGAWLRNLHDRGVWQRDMKPDNVIVTSEGGSRPELYIVDITDVRFLPSRVDEARCVRNLGQLLDLPARFDPIARDPLLASYLGKDGKDQARWDRLVAIDIEARRARRKRLFDYTYVDEETDAATRL